MKLHRQIAFANFPNQWTPLLASKALGHKKPIAEILAGVPIVLFRDSFGQVNALVDRCPHRSVKLSNGKIGTDGNLACPFHGMRFDGNGACQAVPLNANIKLDSICAQALACEEHGGLIWVFTGSKEAAPPLLIPNSLDAPQWIGSVIIRDWKAHWSRAIQTMLDVSHIPFVHPTTIGVAFGRTLGQAVDMRLGFDLKSQNNDGFRLDWHLEDIKGQSSGDKGWLEFLPPNGMTLGIPQKEESMESMLHIWCVPLGVK